MAYAKSSKPKHKSTKQTFKSAQSKLKASLSVPKPKETGNRAKKSPQKIQKKRISYSHTSAKSASRSPKYLSLHTSRAKSSQKNQRRRAFPALAARNTILSLIAAVMLMVILAIFFRYALNPEHLVKQDIETLAAHYYQDYLYSSLVGANSIDGTTPDLAKIMQKYESYGFAPIPLRQLLAYGSDQISSAAQILSHCDESSTSVRIYPFAPYSATDFTINYTYDCDF